MGIVESVQRRRNFQLTYGSRKENVGEAASMPTGTIFWQRSTVYKRPTERVARSYPALFTV